MLPTLVFMACGLVKIFDFALTVYRLFKQHLVRHPISQVVVTNSSCILPVYAHLHGSFIAKVKLDPRLLD